MGADADLLARMVSDALTGKPVKLGFLDTPKILSSVKGLQTDTAGRMHVFDTVARACIADPVLKAHLLSLMRASP